MADPFARWFRFFDALNVRLEGELASGAARGFARKFRAYEMPRDPGRADLTFRVGPFVPRQNDEVRLFNDYRVSPGVLCRARQYKIAKWLYEVAGMDGERWTVRLAGNAGAHQMMHHLTMTPWLQLALSVRGFVPMHAAAAVRADDPARAVLLAGRRGVGKTTLIGRLLDRGYHVVSEDRVFVRDGVAHGLRVPVNLKFDRADPKLAALPMEVRRRLRGKALLASATRGYIALHEPVDAAALLPGKLAPACPLRKLLYLQSGPGFGIEPTDALRTARRIILGNRFEDPATIEDLLAYRYCIGHLAGRGGDPWDADEAALRDALSTPGVTLKQVKMPITPGDKQWDAVIAEATA